MNKIKSKENVLAYGEVTGHAHRVSVDVYEGANGIKEFAGLTTITHEEHKPVSLPNKQWASGIVNEYDHLKDMKRKVVD